jgi:hypothetical protein
MSKKLFFTLIIVLIVSGTAVRAEDIVVAETMPAAFNENAPPPSPSMSRFYQDVKFRDNFKKKYKSSDFQYEKKELKTKNTFWDNFKAWLARFIQSLFKVDQYKAQKYLNNTFETVGVVAFLLLLFFIIKAFLKHKGIFLFQRKDKILAYTATEVEEFGTFNFEQAILDAYSANDKRNCIRLCFLYLLQKYRNAKLIEWHPEKTNYQYYLELKNPETKQKFKALVKIFDAIWYGNYTISEEMFQRAYTTFKQSIDALK